MAQAGYTPIRLYYSTTASAVPDAANLAAGELALNINDMKLYCENSSGVVTLLASASGASGDVVGPASATDNAVARFDLTTGKLIQNSAVTIADTTGDITGGAYNKVTITAPATAATLTIADGKTLTTNNSITLAGTDATTMTFPATSTTVAGLGIAQTFTQDQTIAGNLTLNAQGDVRFADSDSSNWVAFQGPATVASNVTWTLPSADGTSGQVLQTNGSGTLSFATPGGGALTNNTRQAVTSSATTTINLNSGNVIDLTMAANITTLSFTNVPASGTPILIQIVVRNASDGTAYTITWPNSVYWSGQYSAANASTVQTAPTLATGANGVTVIALLTTDGGTKWRGWVEATLPGGTLNGLYAWGDNGQGEQGRNSITLSSSPIQVGSLTNWAEISTANASSASIKTDGTLWSWGSNTQGQLGDGTTVNRSSPVQIGALTNWSQIGKTNNGQFFCAIKTDGTLWSWGRNQYGQLGLGDVVARSSPVQVGTLSNWAQVSQGQGTTVARKTDGTLWTWGNNGNAQLGNDTAVTINKSSPTQVGVLTTWAYVSMGDLSGFAITNSGTLWGWGYNGPYGQLAQNSTSTNNFSNPVQIGALTNWAKVSGGRFAHGAIKTDGTLWRWGRNNAGQIGDNTLINRSSPVQIGALTDWTLLSCGNSNYAAAIRSNGTLWTWGAGFHGVLGQNNQTDFSSPTQVGSLTNWTKVSISDSFTIALAGNAVNPA